MFLTMLSYELLSFAFTISSFVLSSSQLKAASCARCSSEMPPSKQVNGHSFTICLMVCCSPQSQSDCDIYVCWSTCYILYDIHLNFDLLYHSKLTTWVYAVMKMDLMFVLSGERV